MQLKINYEVYFVFYSSMFFLFNWTGQLFSFNQPNQERCENNEKRMHEMPESTLSGGSGGKVLPESGFNDLLYDLYLLLFIPNLFVCRYILLK